MNTILYNLAKQEPLLKKWFKGGYNPPDKKAFEREKQEKGIAELLVVVDKKPNYNQDTQNIKRDFVADLTAENEFDGTFHVGWEITPLNQEQIDKRIAGKAEMERRNQATKFLENLDVDNLNQSQLINAVKALVTLNR